MSFFIPEEDRRWKKDEKSQGLVSSAWRYAFFLLLLISLIIGIWYAVFSSPRPKTPGELPFIKAEETPVKVKSNDHDIPGITHLDKLIYGRIRSDDTPPQAEHILPDSEPIKMIEQYAPEDINPDAASVSIEELIHISEEQKKE